MSEPTICPKCGNRVLVDNRARGEENRDGARVDPRPEVREYIHTSECSTCFVALLEEQRRQYEATL